MHSTNEKMYYNIKYIEKSKDRFSRLLRHMAWKRRGSILKGKDKESEKKISGEAYI